MQRKKTKNKRSGVFKNRGSIIDKGSVYVVVILTFILFLAYVMVGGTLPTKLPKVNTNLVTVNIPTPQPSKSGLQLYTFSGTIPTRVPTQPPLPTPLVKQPILVDCGRQITGSQKPQILWAYSLDASPASGNQLALKAFYTSKDALLLGAGSISPMKQHPADHVASPLLNVGDAAVKDSDNFPLFPSIFLTDTTTMSTDTSGDAQAGGQPNPPDDLYGAWKAYREPNPQENNRSLGSSADQWPPANVPGGTRDSNFTAEIIWKLANVKAKNPATTQYEALQPAHRYRAQIALHDGANPSNIGVSCINFLMPNP